MKQNFKESVSEEVDYFIQKFIDAGWEIEDENYLVKNVDFETHPDAANEYWKNKVSLSFEPKLLEYYNRAERSYVLKIWIECSANVTLNKDVKWPEDCPRIRKLAKFFQEELSRIGLKPFMDEDAFMNHFYSPKVNENLNVTSIGFYLNKDYPDGMWVNHTL